MTGIRNGGFDRYSLSFALPSTQVGTMSARIVPSQFDMKHVHPSTTTMQTLAQRRGRSNSLLKVEEVAKDMLEEQSAYSNINVEWVNRKGVSLHYLPLFLVSPNASQVLG